MGDIHFGDLQFAVREHHATSKHWDFRFEFEGKLWSWASKGRPNLNPYKPVRLFWTGYHQLKYLLSERIIPKGMRGAGPTAVGDKGVFRLLGDQTGAEQFAFGHIRIYLCGGLLRGVFSLKNIGPRPEDWLLTKEWDQWVDSSFWFPNVLTPKKILELEGKISTPMDLPMLF